jgi:hypothetical protein
MLHWYRAMRISPLALVIALYGSWCETLLPTRTFDLNVSCGCASGDDGL